jgi:regulator of protease activity HflC (stomatin/prohibitin superfamily)
MKMSESTSLIASLSWLWISLAIIFFIFILPSLRIIGPTEVGLVTKRFGLKRLSEDNPIAFNGEAGYQADLLMPGWRWKFWVLYKVEKFPWVQVPAGEIGVVIAQVGEPLPIGAKSARYKPEFGNFTDLRKFIENGGQKGVQRPVLPPGSLLPIHPIGFLVITKNKVYGRPISPELRAIAEKKGELTPEAFGLSPEQLELVRIEPQPVGPDGKMVDMIGIVTTFEGDPLPPGDIASRLGGFSDIEELERRGADDLEIIEALLGSKNTLHNNYQDFQAFLDNGGKIGLQHDPLLYGAYALNPFLVSVELVPMLVVEQGQVAVIKAYVGLPTQDISGAEFKFGSLVRPGHRGIWKEPLRTGKYAINPRCYEAEIVPTAILTLNWAEAVSEAHRLDANLMPIVAKSREGFVFRIDLQVQIHIPDTLAPRVISIVGTMKNLVSEVLQAAVGNHFRDKLQSMPAIKFIETRQQVQQEAFEYIKDKLAEYQVETKGVYIQDVILPDALVKVLTEREIANQEIQTYQRQKEAEEQRIAMEQAKGTADMQASLARARVGVEIAANNAQARKAEAEGEATYIRETGAAKGAEVEAVGLARAKAYKAQVEALGQIPTAIVNAITALAESKVKFVPDILVTGGGSAIEGLAGTLMRYLSKSGEVGSEEKEEEKKSEG